MSLLSKIKEDQLSARKIRAQAKAILLTTLYAEAAIIGKNENRDTTDEEVIATIKKFVKNIKECLTVNLSHDLKTAYEVELEILNEYLPKQLGEDEIRAAIGSLVAMYKAQNLTLEMGRVMKHFKDNHPGLYDGRTVSIVAKEMLA